MQHDMDISIVIERTVLFMSSCDDGTESFPGSGGSASAFDRSCPLRAPEGEKTGADEAAPDMWAETACLDSHALDDQIENSDGNVLFHVVPPIVRV